MVVVDDDAVVDVDAVIAVDAIIAAAVAVNVVVAVVALFVVVLLFHHLCRPQKLCPRATRSGIPTSGHTQDSFRIAAPPPEVHKRRRQLAGGLPAAGDIACTAESLCWCSAMPGLILVVFSNACSDFGGVQKCLF